MQNLSSTELLAKLVSFDTTSRNSNLPLIEFVENYLGGFGIRSLRIDYEDGKTNLYATIGPDIAGGIVLSGHTDVVPVDGQNWTSDAFEMREQDGLLFGRGTADMKGFIAVALAMVPKFLAADLKKPIHFAFSCDEEVGCTGVRPLIDHIRDQLPLPGAVIVGEPSNMRVIDAHKGSCSFTTTVSGQEAHASCTHLGVNAIMYAGKVLGELGAIANDFMEQGDPSGRFHPPYTSLSTVMIDGGTATNIIPKTCSIKWDTRLLPGQDRHTAPDRLDAFCETLRAEMAEISEIAGIATECTNYVPGLKPQPGSAAETLALHCAGANSVETVPYGTEAGLFQEAGIPAIICGPGSIDQAHKPDEFIAISELDLCEQFMDRLTAHCAAEGPSLQT